jgi:1,2-diacylglycerol 3-beta-galactosyltransferase
MPKVELMFFDAGGGHRNAANALRLAAREQCRDWDIDMVHVGQKLEPVDFFKNIFGIAGEDVYNIVLRRGWTLGSSYLLRVTQAIIQSRAIGVRKLLAAHFRESKPDLVVSLIPNFNRQLHKALRKSCPDVPFVTVLTDISDFPPHFWIERQPQYLVCGSDRAVQQAYSLGYRSEEVYQSSGMIVHPRFYQQKEIDRREERRKLGLDPDLPTALVLFGGQGNKVMLEIFERLQRSNLQLQVIFICRRNERLMKRFMERRSRFPVLIEGFTKEIPYYMQVSDFLIGKPGPGSISEALLMGLPVIVQQNAWNLPQERYNATWVQERNVGIVLRRFRYITEAVSDLLTNGKLAELQANTRAIENRSVYETLDYLAEIMTRGPVRR